MPYYSQIKTGTIKKLLLFFIDGLGLGPDNPEHNPRGDFSLHNGLVKSAGNPMYTYSGIGVFRPAFFNGQPSGPLPLGPIIREQCKYDQVSGQLHEGLWTDAGTVERLQQLEQQIMEHRA